MRNDERMTYPAYVHRDKGRELGQSKLIREDFQWFSLGTLLPWRKTVGDDVHPLGGRRDDETGNSGLGSNPNPHPF